MDQAYNRLEKLNTKILGISTDSAFVHKAWMHSEALGPLKYPLGADTTHEVSKSFGVLDENIGASLRGAFIIDPEGSIRYSVLYDLNIGRSVHEIIRVLLALQTGGLCKADWKEGDPNL